MVLQVIVWAFLRNQSPHSKNQPVAFADVKDECLSGYTASFGLLNSNAFS